MRQQKSFRVVSVELISQIQILYQNEQIDSITKDKLINLIKSSLSDEYFAKTQLIKELKDLKSSLSLEFKDNIFKCLELLE
jgi:hypothetical protein